MKAVVCRCTGRCCRDQPCAAAATETGQAGSHPADLPAAADVWEEPAPVAPNSPPKSFPANPARNSKATSPQSQFGRLARPEWTACRVPECRNFDKQLELAGLTPDELELLPCLLNNPTQQRQTLLKHLGPGPHGNSKVRWSTVQHVNDFLIPEMVGALHLQTAAVSCKLPAGLLSS